MNRPIVAATLAASCLTALAGTAAAQDAFPESPMQLVVPYPAGGATDTVGRVVAEQMAEALGQPVVVVNRPGAGTMVGAASVAQSGADGYTMLLGDTGTYALNPTLYEGRINYDPLTDLRPVCRTSRIPLILTVNPEALDVDSTEAFVAAAAEEEGSVDFAAPGPGSPIHLAMERFLQDAEITANPIPYQGGADAMQDLLGGRIAAMFVDIGSGLSHYESGALRPLGIGTDERVEALPDLPTIDESGYPGFEAIAWNGISVPADTPDGVVETLTAACLEALESDAVNERLGQLSVQPWPAGAEEFGSYIESEIGLWNEVITTAGITIQQ